ncbi:MAG: hypothetical protein V1903_01350 [Bacteroidota bacterium]
MKQIPALFILLIYLLSVECSRDVTPIDRKSMVTRHNLTNTTVDSLNSLTLGNGKFAFTGLAFYLNRKIFPNYGIFGLKKGKDGEYLLE